MTDWLKALYLTFKQQIAIHFTPIDQSEPEGVPL
jgi:hypothetical protein